MKKVITATMAISWFSISNQELEEQKHQCKISIRIIDILL